MDLKTSLVYQVAKLRLRRIEQYATRAEELQAEQLRHILARAARTDFGRRYGLTRKTTYSSYCTDVPIVDYEGLKDDIERMTRGERDILVPGPCQWFAKSSGTTSDRSKYIPVPYLHLQDCHYRGGSDALWIYLRNYPDSRFFSTKGLVLGGSHSPMPLSGGKAFSGDLSAILVEHMPLLGDMLRVPSRETLLMSEWTAKMQAIVQEVATARVGSLSGVPSWMLVLLKEVLQATGRESITEVWPDLEIFFHGGISFTPYRSTYAELIPSERMRYEETYNASEGFFAIQDDPAEAGGRLAGRMAAQRWLQQPGSAGLRHLVQAVCHAHYSPAALLSIQAALGLAGIGLCKLNTSGYFLTLALLALGVAYMLVPVYLTWRRPAASLGRAAYSQHGGDRA